MFNQPYNVARLELLVRLGLHPIQSLPILKRAIDRLSMGALLTPEDRFHLDAIVKKMLRLLLDDDVNFQRTRNIVTLKRATMREENTDLSEVTTSADLKAMPEGMLDSLANSVKSKEAAGGRISDEDKKMASRARAELRRRRDAISIREKYDLCLNQVLEEYEISALSDLPLEKGKEFFNRVEELYK